MRDDQGIPEAFDTSGMPGPHQGGILETRQDTFEMFLEILNQFFSFVNVSWSAQNESQHKEHIAGLCRGCNGDSKNDP